MFFGNHNFYSLLYGYILFNILLLNSICNIATAAICRCVQVVWLLVFLGAGGSVVVFFSFVSKHVQSFPHVFKMLAVTENFQTQISP